MATSEEGLTMTATSLKPDNRQVVTNTSRWPGDHEVQTVQSFMDARIAAARDPTEDPGLRTAARFEKG